MLERICKNTEFEVEGWRKILPLIQIMKANISPIDLPRIKLEMKRTESIIKRENFIKAMYGDKNSREPDVKKLNVGNIKDSWIYKHFTNSKMSFQKDACGISQSMLSH